MTETEIVEKQAIESEAPIVDQPIPRIVVGVDGSPGANRALDWAVAEADRSGAFLTMVSAWAHGGFASVVLTESDAEHVVDEAMARVVNHRPGAKVEQQLATAPVAEALIRASRGADLLVVGSRGLGGFRGLLLGSVSQHCLTHAPCSVAIIRPPDEDRTDDPGASRHIVVGVDGSDSSNVALDWAANEARLTKFQLTVVVSWYFPGASTYVYSVDAGTSGAAEQVAKDALARVSRVAPGVVVRASTGEDPPGVALVNASRDAELVVVGARGLGAFRGLLLGSVSQYLAGHAHCSVVVARGQQPG